MASPFETLPVELVGRVACLLELRDLRALRLSSRSLAAKAAQGSFKTYFLRKRVQLAEDLESFVKATKENLFGCTG
jgi:hypothetical protein